MTVDIAMLSEALELARHVRRMTRAENVHARGIAKADASGREAQTSRDAVDLIHADLYAAWPAKRLDALIRALLLKDNSDAG